MRHFLAIGPNGWGKGFTAAEAVRHMKKAVPGWHGTKYRYETFEIHPDTTVGDLGDLSWPTGHPPISLGVTNPKTKYILREPSVPAFGFRGVSAQKSHRKVRVTEAEQKRIDAMVAAKRKAGKLMLDTRLTQKEKLDHVVAALTKVREMGYNSEAARATDTVLACINVAEDALRTVGK